MSRGLFITMEGVEGCGKSTQCRRLGVDLRSAGHTVITTREPGGTPLGDALRALVLDPAYHDMSPPCELLVYCAARAEHVSRIIRPALETGAVVVCDRFSDATRAYQGFGRGLGLETVARVDLGTIEPDLTLLLDLPVDVGLGRARRRNHSEGLDREGRFEAEALAFHERVRAGYLELAATFPERIQVILADRSEDSVAVDIRSAVRARLETRG